MSIKTREDAYKSYNIDGLMDDEDLQDTQEELKKYGYRAFNPLEEGLESMHIANKGFIATQSICQQ